MSNCSTCPSYLTEDGARRRFKKSPGAPMCARFGYLLGKPGASVLHNERITQHYAEDCSEYGKPDPGTVPNYISSVVATPDPKVIMAGPTDPSEHPSSCLSCVNYIEPEVVKNELGWTLGLCGAQGRALFPNRLDVEPSTCAWGKSADYLNPQRRSTEGMIEMDWYSDEVSIASMVAHKSHLADPTEYPTDFPVSTEDEAEGIRAWRKVVNPEDATKFVKLPIFNPTLLSATERELVPQTGDDRHPEWYIDHGGFVYSLAAEWVGQDYTPALWGMAGVGKTELATHVAWLMQLPLRRISLTRSSEVEDIFGKWLLEEGETRWVDGRLTAGWKRPGLILLDEPNTAPNDVWQGIRPLTDNSKQLVLDAAKGQHAERHAWAFLMLAMNPAWDPMYVGTNEISDADGNRLSHIFMELPPEDIERQIIVRACSQDDYVPSDATLNTVMAIAQDIRGFVKDGSLTISWGIRPQISVLRKTQFYDLRTAYRRAVTDRLEPEQAEMILNAVQTHVTGTADEPVDRSRRKARRPISGERYGGKAPSTTTPF